MKTKIIIAIITLFSAFSLSAQEVKYELKSAVIKKTMEMWGQKFEGIQYFDDYGKNESVSFNMQVQGVNTNMSSLLKGDILTILNLDNKTGFRSSMPDVQINYLNLTQEVRDKFKIKELAEETIIGKPCKKYSAKIKELAEETIIGKPCKKYSAEMSRMGQEVSVTTWVWKGIALKTISETNNMAMVEEATDIQENAAVDASNFIIPDDFTITDM